MLMRLGSLIFATPAILLLTLYGIELSAISDCAAQGGHYDTSTAACVNETHHQSSYYQRHSGLVNSMLLLSVAGSLMMTVGMLLKGMSRPKD